MRPRRRITLGRRLVQLVCLALLVYGGYLFKGRLAGQDANVGEPPGTGGRLFPGLEAPKGAMSTTQFAPGSILWPSGATPVLENYPPTLVCRFNPKGGLFKACIVHFFSENATWQTHLKYLLPHLTLFVLLCFLFGRFWCGWVCPIGSLGDFLSWLRRRMNVPVRRFPAGFRNAMVFSAYGLLGATMGISTFIGLPSYARFQCYWFLPYCQVCPARLICPVFGLIKPGWKDFTNGVSTAFTLLAWLVLGLFVAAFYWGRRVWCHLCPVGLVNSWFNRGAGLELHKKAVKCNKCGYCADACPMGLTAMYEADTDRKYNQNGCIMCLRCLEVCPKDGCLSCRFFGRRILESRY